MNGGIGITKSVKETKSGRTRMGKIVKDCQLFIFGQHEIILEVFIFKYLLTNGNPKNEEEE